MLYVQEATGGYALAHLTTTDGPMELRLYAEAGADPVHLIAHLQRIVVAARLAYNDYGRTRECSNP